ncbi:MAG: hypothetical protein LH631_07090 [Alkalinema sp. CAN_BIN05]|nr:hypothetical protein [Alkalinema sp. CAN_BIN05]
MKTDRFLSAKLALVLLPILLTFGTKGAIAGMEFVSSVTIIQPTFQPIVNPPIVPTNVLNSVVMRQEVLKLKPIADPSSNILCSAKAFWR